MFVLCQVPGYSKPSSLTEIIFLFMHLSPTNASTMHNILSYEDIIIHLLLIFTYDFPYHK
jgi:hypothetical protein